MAAFLMDTGHSDHAIYGLSQREQERRLPVSAGCPERYHGLHLGNGAYSGEDERLFRGNVNALFPNAP